MNVERILIRAKAQIKKGQLTEARRLYALVLDKFPQNQNAKNELKKLPQEVSSKNTPELTQQQIDTVIALYHAGQTDQALEVLKKLTQLFPTAAILFNIQGVCYANQQQFDVAISSYQQAVKIQPDYTEVHYNLGVAFNNVGTPTQAISSYKRALEINPDYPEAHYNLGVIYSSQRELSTAISHYRQAIKLKPTYSKALSNLGIALKDMGQLQASSESYRQALKLQPDNPETLYKTLYGQFIDPVLVAIAVEKLGEAEYKEEKEAKEAIGDVNACIIPLDHKDCNPIISPCITTH